LKTLFGLERLRVEPTPERQAVYDAAVQSAFRVAREHAEHLREQKKLAQEAAVLLAAEGLEAFDRLPSRKAGPGLLRALLDRSWDLRHDDPEQMIRFALLATRLAQSLDTARYGAARVADFQCRAWAELGNAYRVADRLDAAHAALSYAGELFEHGTGDEALGVRLLDLQASLAADRRQFDIACRALTLVYRYHRRPSGDRHLAGRALVSKGLYSGYAGNPERAIRLLRKGLSLIDAVRDPTLAVMAVHNQATFLVDCRRFAEAEALLAANRQSLQAGRLGRTNAARISWEEGRIAAGLGKAEAEQIFRRLKEEFRALGRSYDEALVALHLAAVLLARGRADEAETLVLEASRVFSALRIEREALGAVLMLKESFALRQATAALVEDVATLLLHRAGEPRAR
jgi:hypothetical protein